MLRCRQQKRGPNFDDFVANRYLKTEQLLESPAGGAMETYRRGLRANRLLVVLCVVGVMAGSCGWLSAREPRYEATAQLLVSPVPADDPNFLGLPVLRQIPADPTRTIETAAALLQSAAAANRTAQTLRPSMTLQHVLDAVSLKPQGQSNVVAVTATANARLRAAQIANAYAKATLIERATSLRQSATAQIPRVEARLSAVGGASAPGGADLAQRLSALRELAEGVDPSLSLSQPAHAPTDEAGPSSVIVLLVGALAGFGVGSLLAAGKELMTRTIRDEDEAGALYPLPVLARVPVFNRRQGRTITGQRWVPPPATREAFRTLLAQLEQREGGRVVLVTSASPGDGKTTSAINLAAAIAEAGDRVILLDFDLRRPDTRRVLDLPTGVALADVAHSNFRLGDALMPALGLASFSVLATTVEENSHHYEAAKRRLPELIREAKNIADWVVIDTAPLGQVSDALGIVQDVDDIVIVLRPSLTDRRSFETMRDLLERAYVAGRTGLLVISNKPARSQTPYGRSLSSRMRRCRREISERRLVRRWAC